MLLLPEGELPQPGGRRSGGQDGAVQEGGRHERPTRVQARGETRVPLLLRLGRAGDKLDDGPGGWGTVPGRAEHQPQGPGPGGSVVPGGHAPGQGKEYSSPLSQFTNSIQFPWEVYNSRGRWVGDTRLRVECFDEDRVEDCCKAILVKSVSNTVPSLDNWLGVYTSNTTNNGRPAYRHLDKEVGVNRSGD